MDVEKKDKMTKEAIHDEEVKAQEPQPEVKDEEGNEEDSFVYKDQTFCIGDFVYIEPR